MTSKARVDSYRSAPLRVKIWIAVALLATVALPFAAPICPNHSSGPTQAVIAALLTLASIVNVELGRLLEGRVRVGQRPHKGLSAWAMAAVILLPTLWVLPIVAVTYGHARWRGIKVPLYKWITSGGYLVIAAVAAASVLHVASNNQGVDLADGFQGLLLLLVAVVVFLAVESALFLVSAYLGEPDSEQWLRHTMADPSFYLTEASVLTFGALIGLLGADAPWFIVLLVPAFGLLQQAVLHRPLQEQADFDAKTGLLRYEPWRRQVYDQVARLTRNRKPWAVILADLDHFKNVNDTFGHLAGDEVLAAAAKALRQGLRKWDLIARFGGEEFSILLVDVTPDEAALIAERLCVSVRELSTDLPSRISISIGMATIDSDHPSAELIDAISTADGALYQAKLNGRDQVQTSRLGAEPPTML